MPKKSTLDRGSLCTFSFADGRRCRMPRKDKHSQLCYVHQHQADIIDDAIAAGEKIASGLFTDFVSHTSLNSALIRLFISVALGDYDPKTARTLGYLAQIIARSIPDAKKELALSIGLNNMNTTVETCLARVNEHFRLPQLQPAPPQPAPPDSDQNPQSTS